MDVGHLRQSVQWGVGICGALFFDVLGHGNVNVFGCVVPFDGECTVQRACPVSGDSVEFCKCVEEVIDVLFANIPDAKVINNKGEYDVAHAVVPKTWIAWCGVVVMTGYMFGQPSVGNDFSLLEAVHAFADFDVDPSIWRDNIAQVVLVDDLLGNGGDVEVHVFVDGDGHERVEVEVFNITYLESGIAWDEWR